MRPAQDCSVHLWKLFSKVRLSQTDVMNQVNRLPLTYNYQGNTDNAIFGMGAKYLLNNVEQRKPYKHADIYLLTTSVKRHTTTTI